MLRSGGTVPAICTLQTVWCSVLTSFLTTLWVTRDGQVRVCYVGLNYIRTLRNRCSNLFQKVRTDAEGRGRGGGGGGGGGGNGERNLCCERRDNLIILETHTFTTATRNNWITQCVNLQLQATENRHLHCCCSVWTCVENRQQRCSSDIPFTLSNCGSTALFSALKGAPGTVFHYSGGSGGEVYVRSFLLLPGLSSPPLTTSVK